MRSSVCVASIVIGFVLMQDAAAVAQRVRTLDSGGRQVDVLRGVMTWWRQHDDDSPGPLMRRIGGRNTRIPGAPSAFDVRGLDLGVDRSGRVVLVYGRCDRGCRGPFVVDVRRGGERRLNVPARRGCKPGITASAWRDLIAYGLRCRDGRSGVYLARDGRARRVLPLSFDAAKDPKLDLTARFVIAAGQIIATGEPGCSAFVRAPARPNFYVAAIDAHPDRLWWIRERVEDEGGADSELVTAAIDPGCRVRPLGDPLPLAGRFPLQPPFADSLAVTADGFYVASSEIGLVFGRTTTP